MVLAWQGGMESGNALCDVLCGKVNPSGRLTDSIARRYIFYPSASEFGHKNTTTTSRIYSSVTDTSSPLRKRSAISVWLRTVVHDFRYNRKTPKSIGWRKNRRKRKNTGSVAGKTVVQAYVRAPQNVMAKPSRELKAFAKTKLLEAGEEQTVELNIDEYALSSYDDEGLTGYKACWVMEDGEYQFFVGENVRDARSIGRVRFDKRQRKSATPHARRDTI